MESERFICVREIVNTQNQVVIIDLCNNNEITRLPIFADSVIMHPKAKVMALKGKRERAKNKHLINEAIRCCVIYLNSTKTTSGIQPRVKNKTKVT
jgi:hypothetical protein